MEIAEVIRRWQAGPGPQQIAQGTGLSRNTVRKHLAAARAMGIAKDGPPPGEEQLSLLAVIGQSGPRRVETPRQDALERWADYIYRWLTGDWLRMTRIHELLAARGCPVSYPSLRRFLVKGNWRRVGRSTVRMEDTPPGQVAEADFGRLGMTPARKRDGAGGCGPWSSCCAIPATASSGPWASRSWRTSSPVWRRPRPSSAG